MSLSALLQAAVLQAARHPVRPAARRQALPTSRRSLLSHCRTLLFLLAAAGLPCSVALAGDHDEARARAALQAGEIVPLSRVLQTVQQQWNGELIAVKLDREDGGWVYEVKLLAPKGSVIKLEYDARNLNLVKAKGYGLSEARKAP